MIDFSTSSSVFPSFKPLTNNHNATKVLLVTLTGKVQLIISVEFHLKWGVLSQFSHSWIRKRDKRSLQLCSRKTVKNQAIMWRIRRSKLTLFLAVAKSVLRIIFGSQVFLRLSGKQNIELCF